LKGRRGGGSAGSSMAILPPERSPVWGDGRSWQHGCIILSWYLFSHSGGNQIWAGIVCWISYLGLFSFYSGSCSDTWFIDSVLVLSFCHENNYFVDVLMGRMVLLCSIIVCSLVICCHAVWIRVYCD
jgi:hypothetical protein